MSRPQSRPFVHWGPTDHASPSRCESRMVSALLLSFSAPARTMLRGGNVQDDDSSGQCMAGPTFPALTESCAPLVHPVFPDKRPSAGAHDAGRPAGLLRRRRRGNGAGRRSLTCRRRRAAAAARPRLGSRIVLPGLTNRRRARPRRHRVTCRLAPVRIKKASLYAGSVAIHRRQAP